MKTLNAYINESILDSDEKIAQSAKHTHIKQIMSEIALGCKEDDYFIDDDDKIHLHGVCRELIIDHRAKELIRFAEIEPASACQCRVLSMDNIQDILPHNLGRFGYTGFSLSYNVAEDINGTNLPRFVWGNITFSKGKTLDLRIMPNCNNKITINEKGFKEVKYPPGFAESVKEIKINKKL